MVASDPDVQNGQRVVIVTFLSPSFMEYSPIRSCDMMLQIVNGRFIIRFGSVTACDFIAA